MEFTSESIFEALNGTLELGGRGGSVKIRGRKGNVSVRTRPDSIRIVPR